MKKILLVIILCLCFSLVAEEKKPIKLTKKQLETLKDSFNGYPELTKKIQENNKDKN